MYRFIDCGAENSALHETNPAALSFSVDGYGGRHQWRARGSRLSSRCPHGAVVVAAAVAERATTSRPRQRARKSLRRTTVCTRPTSTHADACLTSSRKRRSFRSASCRMLTEYLLARSVRRSDRGQAPDWHYPEVQCGQGYPLHYPQGPLEGHGSPRTFAGEGGRRCRQVGRIVEGRQ